MDMGNMSMPMAQSPMRYTHMTFFWGKDSEILFAGWPGTRGGMYALALVVVFLLAALAEYLGSLRPDKARGAAAAALARAAVHAVRVGVAYVLMLAVMSFNVGVLIVGIAGHAVGFLVFRTGLFCGNSHVDELKADEGPVAC